MLRPYIVCIQTHHITFVISYWTTFTPFSMPRQHFPFIKLFLINMEKKKKKKHIETHTNVNDLVCLSLKLWLYRIGALWLWNRFKNLFLSIALCIEYTSFVVCCCLLWIWKMWIMFCISVIDKCCFFSYFLNFMLHMFGKWISIDCLKW